MLLALVSLGYSCSKDQNPEAPTVEIYNPIINETVYLPDTILVEYYVSQSRPISHIKISVDNGNNIPITRSMYEYPTENNHSGIVEISIDKLSAATTNPPYYVHIAIGDFSTENHYYQEIKLQNKETKFIGFATIDEKPINIVEIKFHNTDYDIYKTTEVNGIFSGSTKSNFLDQVYISTKLPELVTAFEINTGQPMWNKEPQLPYPEFTGLNSADEKLYISTAIGRIIGVSEKDGSTIFTTPVLKDTIPRNTISTDNYIFADFTLRTSNRKVWASFYKPTGIKYLWYPTVYNTIKIFPSTNDRAIIFTNEGGLGQAVLFDLESNIIETILATFNHKVDIVCEINVDQYLISDNNVIHRFNLSDQSTNWVYETTDSIIGIEYETITGNVMVIMAERVKVLSYPNFNAINEIHGFNNLKSIELLYDY